MVKPASAVSRGSVKLGIEDRPDPGEAFHWGSARGVLKCGGNVPGGVRQQDAPIAGVGSNSRPKGAVQVFLGDPGAKDLAGLRVILGLSGTSN